jgi:hypothetical protein
MTGKEQYSRLLREYKHTHAAKYCIERNFPERIMKEIIYV